MLKNVIKKIPGSRRMAKLLGLTPKQAGGRQFLLDMLPKQSVGAEIGVHMGDFSKKIIDSISPGSFISLILGNTRPQVFTRVHGTEARRKAVKLKWMSVT
jgi:hypothetical protein